MELQENEAKKDESIQKNLFRKNLQLKDSIGRELQSLAVQGKKLLT